MRKADVNRIGRALEHVKAAIVHIDNMKWENLTSRESLDQKEALDDLYRLRNYLQKWVCEKEAEL